MLPENSFDDYSQKTKRTETSLRLDRVAYLFVVIYIEKRHRGIMIKNV